MGRPVLQSFSNVAWGFLYFISYVYEILLKSKTWEEYHGYLKEVLDWPERFNPKLILKNCTFDALEVEMLGNVVSVETVKIER